jgi:hypothetical protein
VNESCETCAHLREPGFEEDHLGKMRRSKWHRCSRLFVVTKREKGGREKGYVLPIESVKTLSWAAEATMLHVSPKFVCEQWQGLSGGTLIPRPATDRQIDERDKRLEAGIAERPLLFAREPVPVGEQDGWGLRRRVVEPATIGACEVVGGRERGAFVLVVPDDDSGLESHDPSEEAFVRSIA